MVDIWCVHTNGYCELLKTDGTVWHIIGFCPFTGVELQKAKIWAMQDMVYTYLRRTIDEDNEFDAVYEKLHIYSSSFDENKTPERLKHLITERRWFEKHVNRLRRHHKDGKFCSSFNWFIDDQYGSSPRDVLSMIPIKYCPFCGIALPPEFQQENWWEKEFKNFDWYKKHKMYEWADDYVDDHDWEYPDE